MKNLFIVPNVFIAELREKVDIAVVDGNRVRLLLSGNFVGSMGDKKPKPEWCVQVAQDGASFTALTQKLIPMKNLTSYPFAEEMDKFLNEVEEYFGLSFPGEEGCCSSSEWWVGSDSDEYDDKFVCTIEVKDDTGRTIASFHKSNMDIGVAKEYVAEQCQQACKTIPVAHCTETVVDENGAYIDSDEYTLEYGKLEA